MKKMSVAPAQPSLARLAVYGFGVALVGYLAYRFPPFFFVLAFALTLALVYGMIGVLIRLIRKKQGKAWLKVPIAVGCLALFGMGVGLMRPLQAPLRNSGDSSADLEYAYRMDQRDRMGPRFFLAPFRFEMARRDSLRLSQVQTLLERGEVKGSRDSYHAAFVLHHNHQRDSSLFRQAHVLASQAASDPQFTEDYQIQWLAKATYDRWMVSLGKEQKYNTQGGVSLEIK